jgi:endoglucanase
MKLQHLCILSAVAGSLAAAVEKRANSGFKFYGVSESGAEFGQTKLPGTLGKDYTWPVTSSIDTLMSKGLNTFRIPFLMERLAPNGITGSFDQTYLSGLTTIVNYITGKGAYAIVDPHNYGRYNNNIITSASDFQTFWKNLAAQFASNSKAIFDTNNEYNTEDNQNVANLNQAAINGIRAAGATSQYIFVEGNQWSGAWDWVRFPRLICMPCISRLLTPSPDLRRDCRRDAQPHRPAK